MKHKKNWFKKMHVMFSAGQYRSTEKCYEFFFANYLKILHSQIKIWLNFFINFLSILDHFQVIEIM